MKAKLRLTVISLVLTAALFMGFYLLAVDRRDQPLDLLPMADGLNWGTYANARRMVDIANGAATTRKEVEKLKKELLANRMEGSQEGGKR